MNLVEAMTKAEQTSETLVNDLREAQRLANGKDSFAEMVVNDIRAEAATLSRRIVWAAGATRRPKLTGAAMVKLAKRRGR